MVNPTKYDGINIFKYISNVRNVNVLNSPVKKRDYQNVLKINLQY